MRLINLHQRLRTDQRSPISAISLPCQSSPDERRVPAFPLGSSATAQAAIEMTLQFRNTAFCEIIVGRGVQRMLSFNSVPHLERPERRSALTFA